MSRPTRPPETSFFDEQRPAGGNAAVGVRLGPLEIELAGLAPELAESLFERYGPYAVREIGSADALRLRLGLEERDYFIDPPETFENVRVLLACDRDRVRYLSYCVAGCFDTNGGRGDVLLARGDYEPPERALENIIRVAVAWQAASRGGVLVHAASAVWNGAAYLFYGESGAGKSTLSECNRRGRVVSDDLSLLLPGENGGLDLIGSPFRGTYTEGDPVVGRFPLRAGFRLIKAPQAEVRTVERVRAMAELVGNLPFVAESFAERPDLFRQVQRTFAEVPLAHLYFCKDDSFWDAIASAEL